jgi:hypothetical protein
LGLNGIEVVGSYPFEPGGVKEYAGICPAVM